MTISIGDVIGVMGIEVTLRASDNSNLETHFYNGKSYKGVSIREFISIEHGFREIICIIEGEYLDERKFDEVGARVRYVRKLKARPLGYFEDEMFKEGIKILPKIGDTAHLLSEAAISKIFEHQSSGKFVIGQLMKEGIDISLPWQRIFNSHLGIFGNTGSGKSNTLTKLYTVLFDNKLEEIKGKSKFVFLDFNGEYIGDQFVGAEHKKIVRLKTKTSDGDKFELSEKEFWDAETLGILFQATANTQKPFLRRLVSGRLKYQSKPESLSRFAKSIFRRVLSSTQPNTESLELLKSLARHIGVCDELIQKLQSLLYNNKYASFYLQGNGGQEFLNGEDGYATHFDELVDNVEVQDVEGFGEMQIRAELMLISDVLKGFVQYEHIRPLMSRIEARKDDFSKVISVSENAEVKETVTVISFRECNQEIKKTIPILIAKHFYEYHKSIVSSPPDVTMHLVIDEAHNILSQQSNREAESWKDYRLDLFEEIIKEGRKFGIFITLASQRPADISATIVSQLHNYFIHRLVNDRDLALLENTISTLDSVSRSQIPNLPQGGCVVTGTTFDIPMLMQIDRLSSKQQPDSRDVDLKTLWI